MYDWAELRHFKYLLTILEKRGFRSAAEALHVTQPNLSVQAKRFQENASISLFRKRKNGRILPTETGLAFVSMARMLLQMRDEIIEALVAIERNEITVARFGCAPMADHRVFQSLCAIHQEILPSCPIQPVHDDPVGLIADVLSGRLDAAIVPLPIAHTQLEISLLRRDRLVVCLRKDHALAQKPFLSVSDLQGGKLNILYHPERHPDAHEHLVSQLASAGIHIEEFSRVSHPLGMQYLVKEGYGFTLVREGSPLEPELTVRSVIGTNWSLETALIYPKNRPLKTLPLVLRKLTHEFGSTVVSSFVRPQVSLTDEIAKKRPQPARGTAVQLALLDLDGHHRSNS